MDNVIKRLGNLLTVKSMVTLMLTIVFAVLSLRGTITAELFMQVFIMIIAFYFGTQKQDDTKDKGTD
jgi:uncharacterized protein (DUF486 family)